MIKLHPGIEHHQLAIVTHHGNMIVRRVNRADHRQLRLILQIDDLQPFLPEEFAKALFSQEDNI